jgi:hypothetical protein
MQDKVGAGSGFLDKWVYAESKNCLSKAAVLQRGFRKESIALTAFPDSR